MGKGRRRASPAGGGERGGIRIPAGKGFPFGKGLLHGKGFAHHEQHSLVRAPPPTDSAPPTTPRTRPPPQPHPTRVSLLARAQVLENYPVSIISGKGYVEVRPSGINKGAMVDHVVSQLYAQVQHEGGGLSAGGGEGL